MALLEENIWKKDSITNRYKEEHSNILNAPSKMKIRDLADACTYCNSWDNSYADEIVKRAGLIDQYTASHKRKIFNKACAGFGIKMY